MTTLNQQSSYEVTPILRQVKAERQSAKRHYGVHPYFTRRPHNVVRQYLRYYSRERDTVMDPFGGSGVTAIEAFLENRRGIQNDINPLANFIAEGIAGLANGTLESYGDALRGLRQKCAETMASLEAANDEELREFQTHVSLPPNIRLPSTSDAAFYHDLFTPGQLTGLAIIKSAIDSLSASPAKSAMLLAWSATLAKINRTFLSAEGRAESRGGSSIFSIYRYKVANKPVELPIWRAFEEHALNILEAKKEIDQTIELRKRTAGWFGSFEVRDRDVDELVQEFRDQVDYIYTDPPYGGHISYLDLSVLWNAWLGKIPSDEVAKQELIVGGEQRLPEESYVRRLNQSIQSCLQMLKKGRWMSVVFQHWNISYFEAILAGAEAGGAELRAAISQIGDPIWSMHKKKNSESVLAGELILTFFKSGQRTHRATKRFVFQDALRVILTESQAGAVYGESVLNQLVVAAWQYSAIDKLAISKNEFSRAMEELGWQYDSARHIWRNSGTIGVSSAETYQLLS